MPPCCAPASGEAFAQEGQAPAPLGGIGARAEQQQGVAAAEPAQHGGQGRQGWPTGSGWLTEICPPLAKLVSRPGARAGGRPR